MGCLYWIFIGWWLNPTLFLLKLIFKMPVEIIKIIIFAVIWVALISVMGAWALIIGVAGITVAIAKTVLKKNKNKIESADLSGTKIYNKEIDYMTGEEFEIFIAQILRSTGFYNINLTKGSGDQGVDILAEKDGIKYAFQCKRYDKPVGNKAVQEVFAGKFYYHCHTAVVVTNNYFTQSAKELAYENGVVLWDRDYVHRIANIENEYFEVKQKQKTKMNEYELERFMIECNAYVEHRDEMRQYEDIREINENNKK